MNNTFDMNNIFYRSQLLETVFEINKIIIDNKKNFLRIFKTAKYANLNLRSKGKLFTKFIYSMVTQIVCIGFCKKNKKQKYA